MMFLQLEGVARLPIYMPKAVRWSCHPFSSVFCSTLSDIIDAIRNTPVIISNLSSTVPVCIRNPEFDGGLTLEECLGFEEPVPPVFQRSGSQVSRQLTSLKLSISTCLRHLAEPDPEATTLQTTIQEIMYSCLNLRLLCLKQPYGSRGFGRFDHTPYLFGQEGGRLIFPHLQKLHLENFRLTANTTLAILHRYKNSLKEIVIGNIESMKGLMANTTTAEWGTLLDSLRDMDFQSFQIREPSEAIAFVSYEDLQQKSEFWLRATDYVQQTLDGNPLTDQLSSRNTYLSGPNTTRDQVVILGSR